MPALKYSLSFSLSAVGYDLQPICGIVGMNPTIRHVQGMPRVAPNGKSIGGLYKRHFALFKLDHPDMREPNPEICSFVESINGCRDEISRVTASGGNAYITVTWITGQNRGEVFEVETLSKLAQIGVALGIEVFADDDDG